MVQNRIQYLRRNSQKSFKRLEEKLFSHKKLSSIKLNNAIVLPNLKDNLYTGGCVSSEGWFVPNSGLHEGKGGIYEYDRIIEEYNITVIYLGFLLPVWGHVITDFLKKVWFVHTKEGKELLDSGARIVFTSLNNKEPSVQIFDLLRLAGIDLSQCIHVKTITRFSTIIIPDDSIYILHSQRYYTIEYKNTINIVKGNLSIHNNCRYPSKIYLTRTHLHDLRDYGEDKIENLFKIKGFHIIAPEEYTLAEQIELMINCNEVATTEGSISHNVVFCKEGTLVYLLKKADYWNGYQMIVNDVSNSCVTWIDAHRSIWTKPGSPWAGPFFLCLTPQLRNFFCTSIIQFPYILSIEWIRYNYCGITNKFYRFFSKVRALLKIRSRVSKQLIKWK